jgi:hypothetical protein
VTEIPRASLVYVGIMFSANRWAVVVGCGAYLAGSLSRRQRGTVAILFAWCRQKDDVNQLRADSNSIY